MARGTTHPDTRNRPPRQYIDGNDFVTAGIGDECVAGLRACCGIARLVEATLDWPQAQAGTVDERNDPLRRMTDDRELAPDALDAPRSRSRGNRAQDLAGGKLDDGDAGLGIRDDQR